MNIVVQTIIITVIFINSFYLKPVLANDQTSMNGSAGNTLNMGTLHLLLLQQRYWEKTIGGDYSDTGYFVQQTTDGGYVIVGTTASYGSGGPKVYLLKINDNGTVKWSKTYGDAPVDYGISGQQTTDGGYIITGGTKPEGAAYPDVYLLKTDSDGTMQWSRSFGGDYFDVGHSVQQTTDGGYIIAGITESFGAGANDVYLIKTNANGIQQWDNFFGGPQSERGRSVRQTTDGGYIVTGSMTTPSGDQNIYLFKADSDGDLEGSTDLGGTEDDYGNAVLQTPDGGYLVLGTTESYGSGESDVYLVKTTYNGIPEWQKTYGGVGNETGNSIQFTQDGGYIIVGSTDSFGSGGVDVYLIKTDASGNKEWSTTFGGEGNDPGYWGEQTSDGGFIITGEYGTSGSVLPDVYYIRTDKKGSTR